MIPPGNYATRIAAARESRGLQLPEVADCARIGRSAYLDLELHDDEIRMGVTAHEAARVLLCLQLSPFSLFGRQSPAIAMGATYADLAREIRQYLRRTDCSIEQFELDFGWSIRDGLGDPERFGELPLDGLADVSEPVGFDWRNLLCR